MFHKSTRMVLAAFGLACCAVFTGCAREVDVTESAQFNDVRGKCFQTKDNLLLQYSVKGRVYSIAPAAGSDATSDMPLSTEEYEAHPVKYSPNTGPRIISVIPAGTRFRVSRLLYERAADGSLAYGTIIDGKYAGKEFGIWELLENPNLPHSPTEQIDRFEANSTYLEPVKCRN